jgi:MFS family permease
MGISSVIRRSPDHSDNSPRQRVITTAFAAVAFGSTGVFAVITVAPLVAVATTNSTALSGLPTAAIGVGSVFGATLVSRITAHRGRRGGLLLGYSGGVAGAVLAAVAVTTAAFALFVVGMLLVGLANSAVLQSRYAAADLSPVRWRASVLSWVLWAATIGAVAGPSMVSPVGDLLAGWGLPSLAGGFTVAAVAFLLSVVCCLVLPQRTSTTVDEAVTSDSATQQRHLTGQSGWSSPILLIALTTMIVAQIVLASIQTMTPVHAVAGGVGLRDVGLIMSAHIVGMYAFTPVAGWVADRIGGLWVIIVGLTMMASASVIAGTVEVYTITPLGGQPLHVGCGMEFRVCGCERRTDARNILRHTCSAAGPCRHVGFCWSNRRHSWFRCGGLKRGIPDTMLRRHGTHRHSSCCHCTQHAHTGARDPCPRSPRCA